jgi:hypothetical protein
MPRGVYVRWGPRNSRMTDEERLALFRIKVGPLTPTGCREWQGSISPSARSGYGQFWNGRRMVNAHRAHWILVNGPTDRWILHTCDNRRCVELTHLYEGDLLQNTRDRDARGRGALPDNRGERNGQAKLTAQDVAVIRSLLGTLSQRAIARRFHVGQEAISSIARGATWTHA